MENLHIAFPEWSEEKRREVMWQNLDHFGRVISNFFGGYERTKAEVDAVVEVHGIEHLDEALKRGRGALLLTGHFGNWEVVAAWLSLNGYPLSVVIRDADTADVNDAINMMRRKPGTHLIPRGNAAREIITRLRNNEIIGILPDQNSKEIFIPFFGKPAGTVLGPGVIASRTGAAPVFGTGVRIGVNKYLLEFHPPLEPEEGWEVKGEGLMRTFHRKLEEVIREHPEQYLWMHDRWRSAKRKKLL